MVDKFVFSNFAYASLQEEIDTTDTTLWIASGDIFRFPTLAEGTKFPIILSDTDGNAEICYVSSVGFDGSMQVERGKEGSVAQPWTAGTQVTHGFTANSVYAGMRLTPRGTWANNVNYLPGDLVLHAGISYVASDENFNQAPTLVSVFWQPLFVAQSGSGTNLIFRGPWVTATNYDIGDTVAYQGRLWVASQEHDSQVPAQPSSYWDPLAQSHNWFHSLGAIPTTAAVNNYVIDGTVAVAADIPSALYHGLTFKIMPAATNTIEAITLTLGANPPRLIRKRPGVPVPIGAFKQGTVYELTYWGPTNEYVMVAALGGETATDIAYTPPPGWAAANVQTSIDEVRNYFQTIHNTQETAIAAVVAEVDVLQAISGWKASYTYWVTSNGTYTPTPGCKAVRFYGVGGGGGGGGGTAIANGQSAAGGGGAAGAEFDMWLINPLAYAASFAITIGAGGAPGASGAAGATGGSTVIAGVASAGGGQGGLSMAGGTALAITDDRVGGHASVVLASTAIAKQGEAGLPGMRLGATTCVSGKGGHTRYGAGGDSKRASGASSDTGTVGSPGGWGAGGSGGARKRESGSGTGTINGAAGGQGLVEIQEFF